MTRSKTMTFINCLKITVLKQQFKTCMHWLYIAYFSTIMIFFNFIRKIQEDDKKKNLNN